MPNAFISEGHTVKEVASVAIPAGSFAFENNVFKFYSGSDTTVAGTPVAPYTGGVTIQLKKASAADTFSVGAPVFASVANQNALTAGGDGQAGICAKESLAGDEHVYVRLTN